MHVDKLNEYLHCNKRDPEKSQRSGFNSTQYNHHGVGWDCIDLDRERTRQDPGRPVPAASAAVLKSTWRMSHALRIEHY